MIYGTRAHSTIDDRAAAESVKERVFLAVQDLCVGSGDVRSRLISAISTLWPLSSSEFPKVLQSDFEWIMSESTKYKSDSPMQRNDLEATMKKINNSTGVKIAQRIFDIYKTIQDIRGFPLLGSRKRSE